jgi:predicted MFS family arabinose efflux permease
LSAIEDAPPEESPARPEPGAARGREEKMAGDDPKARLYTVPYVSLLSVTLLGYIQNFLLQPVLPVLVLSRGGDATLVGLVVAAFSLPSVVLRPVFGRLVDEWNHRLVYIIGTVGLAISSALYLVPSLAVLFVVRVFHGTAWAAYNTGGHAGLARLAPADRRGEASGIYNLMPGIGQLVGPTLGLALLAAFGFEVAFLTAAAFAAIASVVVTLGPLGLPTTRVHAAVPATGVVGRLDRFLEPGAVLPMSLEFLFTSAFTLFLVFPPVFAAQAGIPLGDLTRYYPVFGTVLVASRFLLRGLMDRLARETIVIGGSLVAMAALATAAAVPTLGGLTIAGALYAFAAAFTSPTLMAMAIDRSDPKRVGSAMATYSLGFQMALGVGAAIWGVTIDRLGYPAPYLLAIGSQVVVLAYLLIHRRASRAIA